jgi:hypothetical protein
LRAAGRAESFLSDLSEVGFEAEARRFGFAINSAGSKRFADFHSRSKS